MTTLVQAKDRSPLKPWFTTLRALASMSPRCAQWVCVAFAYKRDWMQRMLVVCPHGSTRRAVLALLVHCIEVLRPTERGRYLDRVEVDPTDLSCPAYYTTTMFSSPVSLLINGAVNAFVASDHCTPHLTELATLLLSFAKMGPLERGLLLSDAIFIRLVDFYAADHISLDVRSRTPQGTQPCFLLLAETLGMLVCSTPAASPTQPNSPYALDGAQVPISPRAMNNVLRVEFLNRLVLEHVQVACQALVHLCFMNAQLSVTLCTSLRNSVVTATQHTVSADLKPFFKALSAVVLIDDELKDVRVEQVLPPLFDRVERLVVRQESSDHSYLFLATRLLLMLAVQSQAAFAFLADNKAAWEAWLERFKEERRNRRAQWSYTAAVTRTAQTAQSAVGASMGAGFGGQGMGWPA